MGADAIAAYQRDGVVCLKDAFFYKYLYSTDANLADDPSNSEGWALSNTGINNTRGIAYQAIEKFVASSAIRLGYKPISVYGFNPASIDNTESFLLRPIYSFLWPTDDPQGYMVPTTHPGISARIADNVYATGTQDTWPYTNCGKLLQNSHNIGFDDKYRIPFYAFSTQVSGTIPIYQFAYRKIWYPGYFVYSAERMSYDGTGLDPTSAGPAINLDGNDWVAFYAFPPPSD